MSRELRSAYRASLTRQRPGVNLLGRITLKSQPLNAFSQPYARNDNCRLGVAYKSTNIRLPGQGSSKSNRFLPSTGKLNTTLVDQGTVGDCGKALCPYFLFLLELSRFPS